MEVRAGLSQLGELSAASAGAGLAEKGGSQRESVMRAALSGEREGSQLSEIRGGVTK